MAAQAKPLTVAISQIPVLDSSVGSPAAYSDPKSNASMAARIQGMGDQLQADRLYDAPAPARKDGFQDLGLPEAPILSARMPDGPNCYRPNRNSVNAEACGLGLPPPSTWIQQQMSCQKPCPSMKLLEGYTDVVPANRLDPVVVYSMFAAGAALLLCVFIK
jgi:hypothetical protein